MPQGHVTTRLIDKGQQLLTKELSRVIQEYREKFQHTAFKAYFNPVNHTEGQTVGPCCNKNHLKPEDILQLEVVQESVLWKLYSRFFNHDPAARGEYCQFLHFTLA